MWRDTTSERARRSSTGHHSTLGYGAAVDGGVDVTCKDGGLERLEQINDDAADPANADDPDGNLADKASHEAVPGIFAHGAIGCVDMAEQVD